MEFNEFTLLEDGVYEFITYMDEKLVGIPFSDNSKGAEMCFIIPHYRIKEFKESRLTIDEKVENGQLISINPNVVDEHKKLDNL